MTDFPLGLSIESLTLPHEDPPSTGGSTTNG